VSAQGTGFFTKDSDGRGISRTTTNTGGFILGYRYPINRWLSALWNYGFDRDSQKYFSSSGDSRVKSDVHAATAGLGDEHSISFRNGTVVRALVEPATLNQLHYRADVEVVLGGLHEAAVLMRAVKGAEVVLHLAGKIPGSPVSDLFEVNVRGTGIC
jgi:hypothetical protein